jgi:para-aminobenzoate synthetase/4-amino-4-deoxychorismate lyase
MPRRHLLPAETYAHIASAPGTILLEGGLTRPNAPSGFPTRLFTQPLETCIAWTASEIPALFAEIERAVAAGHTAAGFFSYECGAAFEPKARQRAPRPGQPLAWFGIYDAAHAFEGGAFSPPESATTRLHASELATASGIRAEFALSEQEYVRRIEAIHEWIRSGDVYQINFTAPMRLAVNEDPATLYARLRQRQPVNYGAFIHWEENRRILSFSPELFFRVDQSGDKRRIVTRPMKGTARRGRTCDEDRAVAEWLRADAKNRAENLMIVDLLRNDLGRIARFGSVSTKDLFTVERLPTLWQMTSTVAADLRDDVTFHDIFRALFPCGSITGAPKVRAMQLISQLEELPRGVYTGAIGFFSPRQTIFNVAIRTVELQDDRGIMGIGSGIVIDSDPTAEYRECLLKAEFLTQSATQQPDEFQLIETMLWQAGFPLLELHLDRLAGSADYFDFAFDRTAVEAALHARAQQFANSAAQRVRLLLSSDGSLEITDQPLAAPAHPHGSARVRVAAECTDPADPMLFHKTTHRPLYSPAYEAAVKAGCDDALFFNTRGELTEGAISNVFIEQDGCWFTPPIDCGVLPGVYRRHLLDSQRHIEERVLRDHDLRAADAVYIANAVRGLRKVAIDWS